MGGVTRMLFPLLALCVPKGLSFNLDSSFPIILGGNPGSYFGYSVAFHSNREGELALVTAPRDNFTMYNGTVHQPGVLYKCDTTGRACDQVLLDLSGNSVNTRETSQDTSYQDLKNDSWLGVSLDVQEGDPGYVVTCSHLWKNQLYDKHYLVNGVCYLMTRELNWSGTAKLLPLIERSKQSIIPPGIYHYALGQAGASVTFSEDGKDLIMGAPGFYDWLGTVLEYKVPRHPKQIGRPIVPNPPNIPQLTPEAYIGYSVTTGHFFELAGMSYVTGAPRDAGNNGRVYIFEQLRSNKPRIVVQQKIEGGQLGEYFGASLLSLDLTNNNFSDLLVGSPFYSLKGDEGRVYVLLSDGVGLQLQKDLFMGSSVPFSRFGTSMAKAGDLNQDGFLDVAIGAPYEAEAGAVYIYHGSKAGLRPHFSQKILASELSPSLHGFGISVARSKDIDGNQYPDLLVGAYSSDKAVILRSHPIVQFHPRLDFDVQQVDLNDTQCEVKGRKVTCFNLKACLMASGKHIPDMLEVLVELWADISETHQTSSSSGSVSGYHQPRGQLVRPGAQGTVSRLTAGIILQKYRENCIDTQVQVLPEDVTDIIQPMTFQMNFSLQSNPKSDSFCSSCPVLDPDLQTSITKQIYFRTGCGEDNTCSADLKVHAHIVGLRPLEDEEEAELIHGANKTISLEVKVNNTGEPAYASLVTLLLPQGVGVINRAKCVLDEDRDRGNSSLECKLGNPLRKGQPGIVQVKLDISKMDYRLAELTIKIVSSTSSKEVNPKDNAMLLRVPIRALADITIRGYADREQIEYQPTVDPISLVHTYLILKYYPSPVQSVGVAISVPLFDRATRVQILELESVQVGGSQSASVPGSCNVSGLAITADALEEQEGALNKGGKDAPNTINLVGQLTVSKKNAHHSSSFQLAPPQEGGAAPEELTSYAQVKEAKSSYVMNCGNSLCQTLICSVGPFLDSSKVASIQVKGMFNITAMNYALGNQGNVSLVTGGRVWIQDPDYDPQPYDHRPDSDEVSTDFIMAQQPAKPIQVWIIILAIIAGLLVLAIILLVLYKLGFFKRAEKEEMEKMMQKGALLQSVSEDSGATDKGEPEPENEPAAKEADEFDYINFANSST